MKNIETHLFSFKVVVIGEPEVGKTSIIQQLKDGKTTEKYHRTTYIDFNRIEIEFKESNSIVDLYIFDTPGLGTIFYEPGEITNQVFIDAKYIVFVTDFNTNIQQIMQTIDKIRKMTNETHIVMITNKVDQQSQDVIRSVQEERQIYCDKENIESYFCSARTGHDVKEVFNYIAKKLLNQHK